jgi:hypothetical protein
MSSEQTLTDLLQDQWEPIVRFLQLVQGRNYNTRVGAFIEESGRKFAHSYNSEIPAADILELAPPGFEVHVADGRPPSYSTYELRYPGGTRVGLVYEVGLHIVSRLPVTNHAITFGTYPDNRKQGIFLRPVSLVDKCNLGLSEDDPRTPQDLQDQMVGCWQSITDMWMAHSHIEHQHEF